MNTSIHKPLFFIGLTVFLAISATALGQVAEGEIRYLVVHDWVKRMAALDYVSAREREQAAYMWGNRSEWKEYMRFYFSPQRSRYEESDEKAEVEWVGYAWRKEPLLFYRDFERQRMFDIVKAEGRLYLIEDSLHCPQWKVLNDLKEVAGYVCMNAVWEDSLKGHRVEVWFALDLPVPAGPEDLCGLPGLILEANYNNGAMIITADRIDLRPLKAELELPKTKVKGKKVSLKEYREVVRKYVAEQKKAEKPWFWGLRY
ncbi:MAG: GLPGLI family protein [Saprospiraceae bacterium]|nr:GLPGLI family protein [Saprospiraceae bacterium]MDW8229501.1 GLPGLI family protein [Saprospiraceae bacterium]